MKKNRMSISINIIVIMLSTANPYNHSIAENSKKNDIEIIWKKMKLVRSKLK